MARRKEELTKQEKLAPILIYNENFSHAPPFPQVAMDKANKIRTTPISYEAVVPELRSRKIAYLVTGPGMTKTPFTPFWKLYTYEEHLARWGAYNALMALVTARTTDNGEDELLRTFKVTKNAIAAIENAMIDAFQRVFS